MNLAGLLAQSRQSFVEFWAVRDKRERVMLVLAALTVAFGLAYAVLIEPALAGTARLNRDLPVLRQQIAQMQALSKEAADISVMSAAQPMAMSKENIDTLLARNGLKAQSVMLSGDIAKIQLTAVSFAGTLSWLDDMQKSARISVVDANISALDQPGTVNVTITLHQQRNE